MRFLHIPFRFGAVMTVVAATAALVPAWAQSVPATAACAAPAEMIRLENPLERVKLRLSTGAPIKIVAIGSSSTFGSGASSPAMSYPSRLEVELQALFPASRITVLNRGVGGETVRDMLERFNRDVFAEHPDLVLWQVGSNAVLRKRPIHEAAARLREGLKRLHAADADVILINPQYAPKVIDKIDANRMVELIGTTAKQTRVDLFRRFGVMRHWRLDKNIPFNSFLSKDELHMNDWSYGCIAKLLAGAIKEAATRPAVTAAVYDEL